MIPAMLDVRLVRDSDGRWYAKMEDRRVYGSDGDRPSTVLSNVAKALDGITWRSHRPESVEATDPTSPLFASSPAAALVGLLRATPKDAA